MHRDYLTALLQYLLPKHSLTFLAGLLANVKNPKVKNYLIHSFVKKYGVNMNEALEENPLAYPCFNDFFIRHLKPEKRPLAKADIISPVDGIVSEIGQIEQEQILQAKGRYYTLKEFLAAGEAVSKQFIDGRFATFYLSPKDYHRIHMPIEATLRHMIFVPGKLFSVQPATARVIPRLFARNERLVVFFDTSLGLMAMVLVGATIVGTIGTSWQGEIKRSKIIQHIDLSAEKNSTTLKQGAEMGYFKLGSTVVLLFAKDSNVNWVKELKAGSPVNFGQEIGHIGRLGLGPTR